MKQTTTTNGGRKTKYIHRTLEEWEEIYNPNWYRVGFDNSFIETTDLGLASSFGRPIEYLGKVGKISNI